MLRQVPSVGTRDRSTFDLEFQPYNALLSVHQLLDSTDLTICIDNEALWVRFRGGRYVALTTWQI